MEYNFHTDAGDQKINIEKLDDSLQISIGSKKYKVNKISSSNSEIQLTIDDKMINAFIAQKENTYYVCIDGISFPIIDKDLESDDDFSLSSKGSTGDEVEAPMPGKVIKIFVKDGDNVKSGSKVAILEAMKMENELNSPKDGIIDKVLVKEGELVDAGKRIIEFKD